MILITHNDLDGLGCAVLAKLAFKDEVTIRISATSKDVNKILEKIEEDMRKVINPTITQKIYITDLSCDEKWFHSSKMDIRLFDHHKTAENLNKYSNATVKVMLHDRKTCGTELFHNYLVHKGLIAERPFFVELVRKYDTWDWIHNEYKLPVYLNDMVHCTTITEFISSFYEKLLSHDINELTLFTNDERIMINTVQNIKYKYIHSMQETMYECMVNGYKVHMVFATENISELGNDMLAECDIAIIINILKSRVSFRSKNNIDVSKIATAFGGGGHMNAAGGYIDDNLKNIIFQSIEGKLRNEQI